MRCAAAIVAFLTAGALCSAQDLARWKVRAEVRMIAVPMAEALRLVPRLRSAATFSAAEKQVEALLASGEAELVDWVQVQGESGNKSVAESITEVRYPTEFNLSPTPRRNIERSPFRKSIVDDSGDSPQSNLTIPLQPIPVFNEINLCSSFDTRNTGLTLEFESRVEGKGETIEVFLAARLSRFRGFENTIGGRPGPATYYGYPAARFAEYRVQTGFEIANGAGALIGSFTLAEPKPRMLLFLFHAVAQPKPASLP
jgi:hypothetical protein